MGGAGHICQQPSEWAPYHGPFLQKPWWAAGDPCLHCHLTKTGGVSSPYPHVTSSWREKTKQFPSCEAIIAVSFTYILRGYSFFDVHTLSFSQFASHLTVFCTCVGYICHTHLGEATSAGLYGNDRASSGILMTVRSARGGCKLVAIPAKHVCDHAGVSVLFLRLLDYF